MIEPSSRDLHPKTGARFVFDRVDEGEPRYAVTIYLPRDRRWAGSLAWIEGRAELSPTADQAEPETEGDEELAWALAEAVKLARVLHRDPRPHMVRWRG